MPTYYYRCDVCNTREERTVTVRSRNKQLCHRCHSALKRDIVQEQVKGAYRPITEAWRRGLPSEAMAIHPDQLTEAKKYDAEHGVSVEYNELAQPVFHSRGQRRAYLRAHGYRDNDGGYGD